MKNIHRLLSVIMMFITVFGFSQTVNLNTHVTGTPPTGTVLEWHNAIPISSTNVITSAQAAAASAGTYYAVYYDNVNACYSPYSKVKVVTGTCPSTTFNLTSLTSGTAPAGTILEWHTAVIPNSSNLVSNAAAVPSGTYYAVYHDITNSCYSPVSEPVIVSLSTSCLCYKPAITTGATLDSKVGITSLGRAGTTNMDNWPMNRKGAWLVIESKTKAFIPNRVKFNSSNVPVADDGVTLVITSPVEGMMVFDATNKCLKMYTSTDGGTTFGWFCMATQTCPD
ncbi:hypothetical protein PGH12_13575 [Chryseobacterium wangxinyae]|uniref:hypothetical protein n=1 Tax=Chryseobacterium sp. CY350 TaxID=2997336 RepID=UPI0022710373|nr:hypothetical protein [Chryseobacterium sp. CY350]MCY0975898.1 hypothetical protein [Chryseobacterium sp. CY350]WBZ94496.1 hypothetical protein PGH12_13575 [Chryseobacterium sp. CY350]